MNAQSDLKQLLESLGQGISSLEIEVMKMPDPFPSPICVHLVLSSGGSFVFACAGAGGISVRNGPLSSTDETELRGILPFKSG
jgi:hypothetical protein